MKIIFSIFILLCLQSASATGVYKWVDSQGKTHFSDRAPSQGVAQAVSIKVNSISSVSYESSGLNTGSEVVMYSTAWCGYCKKARAYFRENNISFTDHDIENDSFAKRDYDRLGGRGVPVILVGDKRMNGFSVRGFENIYK